jgi:hypothetical protein
MSPESAVMNHRRRRLLEALGTGTITVLAGCSGNTNRDQTTIEQSPDSTTESEIETTSPTATLTPTATTSTTSATTTDGRTSDRNTTEPATSTRPPEITTQDTKLAAGDGNPDDKFAETVAISGDGTTILSGAPGDDNSNWDEAGSAYVFTRSGRSWTQQAKLKQEDRLYDDAFGDAVGLSGDGSTALIGAPQDRDSNGRQSGAAYVFTRNGEGWTQEAKLDPKDGDADDFFGFSVAVSDDASTGIVAAPADEDPNGERAGSAYVFERDGSEWVQQAKLVPDDGSEGDLFGKSVTVSKTGATALIGAWRVAAQNKKQSGAAYLFEREDRSWRQQARLAANDGDAYDRFGGSVSISGAGSTAVVGTPRDADPNGSGAGSAYIFGRSAGTWRQDSKLAATDGAESDGFGDTVAVSGDGSVAVVGAKSDETTAGDGAGSAYVYTLSDGSWSQQAKLVAGDGNIFESFGDAVSVSNDGSWAVVGTSKESDPNGKNAGAAYVFPL